MFLSKLFTTHITFKVFLSSVDLIMACKRTWIRKFLSTNITFKWFFSCMTRSLFSTNVFSQMSQWNGFSPVWILSCFMRSLLFVKVLWHTSHLKLLLDLTSSILQTCSSIFRLRYLNLDLERNNQILFYLPMGINHSNQIDSCPLNIKKTMIKILIIFLCWSKNW